MTAGPASPGGRQLWGLLPEHYRARDNGDLASYVDALGEVLDLLRGIIQQRVADTSPDDPGLQPWVLPYLADLIDPRVVSADETRRRAEIANAAMWRKSKGTLRMVEQIATVLGGFGWTDGTPAARPKQPVIVQEGFRRVAITPRAPLSSPPEVLADRRKLLVELVAADGDGGLPILLAAARLGQWDLGAGQPAWPALLPRQRGGLLGADSRSAHPDLAHRAQPS